MPVTARLSKHFYDRLGEQIANELVDWFNQVDATYRSDLRDVNDLNFARFDAKLEQRVVELDAKLESRLSAFEAKIERRLTEFEAAVNQRFVELESTMDERFGALDRKIDLVAAGLREHLERRLGDQVRWMVAAWATLLIPIIGLWFRR